MYMGEHEHDYRRVMSTGTLSGDKVVNRQGEDLGKIDDFMLDTVNGCVSYAVLSFGSVLGMGGKLFAVPYQALSLDEANHQFILDISKERLEQAPGFDKNDWPDMASDEFRDTVYGYYGITYGGTGSTYGTTMGEHYTGSDVSSEGFGESTLTEEERRRRRAA